MDKKLYTVTMVDLENTNPYKTWIFDDKKTAYIFLCNRYEKEWNKHYMLNSNGKCFIVEDKSKYPFTDGYKGKDFIIGEYYNIYFNDETEIVFGICMVTSTHIKTENPNVSKDFISTVGEDLREAFAIAEQMIKNPNEVTFKDIIWLCMTTGMKKEIMNAKDDTWLDVTENALRKLGYRI